MPAIFVATTSRLPFHDKGDMDVDAEHARAAMNSVLSQLYDLEVELSAAQGADTTTDQLEASICMAIYNLGNAASPETRMGSFLPSTAQFVETCKLGVGAHGVVVKARDSVTGETVALKSLHPQKSEEEEDELSSYHVLREACFMAACRGHPSLVRLSAIGRHPHTGKYCLVMEHVGPSLYHVLVNQRGGKPFPEHEVRRMMQQVLSGAKAMYDLRLVHRNINATNILVADGGNNVVKIGGFREATPFRSNVGYYHTRLSHIAPECLVEPRGDDPAMDSWSMGCLMLELLTGEDHFYVELDNDDVEGQLQRIDDVLGFSDKRTMEALKPAVDVELPPEVQKHQAQWRAGGRLRELVPREVLSDDGFRVLQGLLTYGPKARLRAADALQLPWFAETFHSPKPRPFSWVLVGVVVASFFLMVFACLRGLY